MDLAACQAMEDARRAVAADLRSRQDGLSAQCMDLPEMARPHSGTRAYEALSMRWDVRGGGLMPSVVRAACECLDDAERWVRDQRARVHAARMLRMRADLLAAASMISREDAEREATDAEVTCMVAAGAPVATALVYAPHSIARI
jgi:hypothetical protein